MLRIIFGGTVCGCVADGMCIRPRLSAMESRKAKVADNQNPMYIPWIIEQEYIFRFDIPMNAPVTVVVLCTFRTGPMDFPQAFRNAKALRSNPLHE